MGGGSSLASALVRNRANDPNDAALIRFAQRRPRGQAQPLGEEFIGNSPAEILPPGVNRLHVHRPPHRSGFNVLSLKGLLHSLSVGAEVVWVDQDTGQPARSLSERRLGHELQARKITEGFDITPEDGPTAVDPRVQHPQLSSSHGGQQVAQPVIVSDFAVEIVVVFGVITRLRGQEAAALSTHSGRSDTSMPPPLVVMILLPLNEKTPMAPKLPAARPR